MVADSFKKHEVVPDVVSVAPEKKIEVKFDSGTEVSDIVIVVWLCLTI